jgi:signal transduction histidine kinase
MAATMLARQDTLNDRQARAVARIAASSDRARRMLRDFLDFTQARSAGGIPVTPRPVNIRQTARQVFDELCVLHRDRPATIAHEGEEEGTWDADRIAQVIGNLLNNAFQHGSAAAPIRLRTRGERDHVVIEVQNQGPPIPAAAVGRLFQPFERGTGSTPAAGVGLGLFISKQIVAAHHGTIDVRSTAGEGTTFTVRLPRRVEP